MKKLFLTIVFMFAAFAASAMSYEQARQEALFLTDKMAYELNLNSEQYEYCYEINLDYLLSVETAADVYGSYLRYRNADLRHILFDWQYNLFIATDYFFHPVIWHRGAWAFPVYRHYSYGYYYYDRPHVYISYRGGHGRTYFGGGYYGGRRPTWNGGLRGYDRGPITHRGTLHGRGGYTHSDRNYGRYGRDYRYDNRNDGNHNRYDMHNDRNFGRDGHNARDGRNHGNRDDVYSRGTRNYDNRGSRDFSRDGRENGRNVPDYGSQGSRQDNGYTIGERGAHDNGYTIGERGAQENGYTIGGRGTHENVNRESSFSTRESGVSSRGTSRSVNNGHTLSTRGYSIGSSESSSNMRDRVIVSPSDLRSRGIESTSTRGDLGLSSRSASGSSRSISNDVRQGSFSRGTTSGSYNRPSSTRGSNGFRSSESAVRHSSSVSNRSSSSFSRSSVGSSHSNIGRSSRSSSGISSRSSFSSQRSSSAGGYRGGSTGSSRGGSMGGMHGGSSRGRGR